MSSDIHACALITALVTALLGAPPAPVQGAGPVQVAVRASSAGGLPAVPGAAKVFLTVDEALELAFPGAEVGRSAIYLSEEDEERVGRLAGSPYEGRIARPYTAVRGDEVVGTAYFDTHRVRTLRETLMVVVDREERITRIEILAFGEPEEFIPRGAWYGQFLGRRLDDELQLGRAIRNVTGATLTARATTDAARRTLALHRVLRELEEEPRNAPEDARVHEEKQGHP